MNHFGRPPVHHPKMDPGPRPLHPILFAAFPVLFLIAHNRDVASPAAAAVPLLLSVAAVGAFQIAGGRLFGRRRKVAIVLSSAAVAFFTYGHAWEVLEGKALGGVVLGRDLVLIPAFAIVCTVISVGVARTPRSLLGTTRVLNVVAVALVMTSMVSLGLDVVADPAEAGQPNAALDLSVKRPSEPRDIYYLIFDRYPDAQTLREHFGFDNRPFLRFLERNGFTVVAGARANYQNTHLSLASSLNLGYLDGLRKQAGGPTRDLSPVFRVLGRNTVARLLKRAGYRYVHVGSWWSPTSESPIADVNLRNAPLSEFAQTFYASTALSPLIRRGYVVEGDRDAVQRGTALRELNSLDSAIGLDGPKFVFAHFLLPHPPYVFDRDGDPVAPQPRAGNVKAFLEQLRFTNGRIRNLVSRILETPRDPIVIVQADEGPYPRLTTQIPGAWASRPDPELRVKYGILSAFHLPGDGDAVYPTVSPVNAFRIVFNNYFGTRLRLLPDESYASRSPADVYDFVPLGDRVRGRPLGHDGWSD